MKTTVYGVATAVAVMMLATSAHAEFQFSGYLGGNLAQDTDVTHSNSGTPITNSVSWDGESFEFPPYWGVRGTYWLEDPAYTGWGFAVDFTHAKAAADGLPAGYSTLEFTDGINILTANLMYRYQNESRYTPYAGIGAGISIPNVEVTTTGAPFTSPSRTFEYQATGVALQALAGVDIQIYENWSLFGEYKFSYSDIDADLTGGDSLETELLLHHFAIGVSYTF